MRKSFSIHSDFFDELRNLAPERRGELLLALINWSEDLEIPELSAECGILFRLMRGQIERISSANSANGAKGGRGCRSEKSETKRKKPPVSVSDTVSISVSDTNESTGDADAPPPPPTGKKQGQFIRPTVDEVASYAQEIGANIDPQRFFDYYTANGWKVGRNPMRDWRAAVRGWRSREPPKRGIPTAADYERGETFKL